MIQSLWVGGPPGKTLENIKAKLAADGIAVAQVQDYFRGTIPAAVGLVLVNIDMLDHSSFDAARAEAKRVGVPVVAARTDYSRTRLALQTAGLIASVKETPVAASSVPNMTNAEEMRTFLASIPKGMRAVAIEELARLNRAEVVEPALRAFSELSDAGVYDFVAGLTADQTALLKAALS